MSRPGIVLPRWPLMLRSAAALLTVVAACLGAAVGASAQWSPAVDLSASDANAATPEVAVDPSGAAIVVWSAADDVDDSIQARRMEANGALGPIHDVSEAGESIGVPRVAVDAAGNATVVWTNHDRPEGLVRSRRITAAGVLEDIKDVSPATHHAGDPRVAVDPTGNATVVWSGFGGTSDIVRARRIATTGALGPVLDVSNPGAVALKQQVAVDGAGNAVIAWQATTGPESLIRARVLDAGGGVGPIVTLSAIGERSFSPQVAVDAFGNRIAAWVRLDGAIQARRGTAAGELGPIEEVSGPRDAAVGPQLAADPSGNATVVWPGYDGTNEIVELRRIASDGSLGEIENLSNGGDDFEPQLSMDGLGNATVVWLHRTGAGTNVQSRTAAAEGGLGRTVDLSSAAVEIGSPRLATHPAGSSTAVWGGNDGFRYLIAGARFTVPPAALLAPPATPVPEPEPAVPASPAPAVPASCPIVTLRKLTPYTRAQPKAGRRRAKGVGSKLTLNRAARVQLLSATLSYPSRGAEKTVKLQTKPLSISGEQPKLRFRLPGKLIGKLGLGRRVTLKLKLRARSTKTGCAFGKAKALKIRTKLIWVPTRSAL